jgi:hypothetical protein
VIKILLVMIGGTMLLTGSWQMILTLRDGTIRARGARVIKRKSHPIIFWLNFGGLVIVCILGVALVVGALLSAN